MKKNNRIFLAVSSVVMALLLGFSVGCNCKKTPKPPVDETKTLQSIELDTGNVKKDYIAEKDEFTAEGLVITATFLKGDANEEVTETLSPSSEGVQVDSSAFNNKVAGVYKINVFYTYGRVFKSASYEVTVIVARAGLDVQLKANQSNEITATAGGTDISAAASWIEVRRPDKFGKIDESSAPLSASEYTVSVYKDANKLDDLTSVKAGAYQIWASLTEDGNTLEGFVIVYVMDTLSDLQFKSGTTQQAVGADEMTGTWVFTATFVTGETKELTLSDKGVSVSGVNTNAPTETGAATVSYTYNGVTKTVTVNYKTVNPKGEVTYKLTYASNGTNGMVTTWDGLQGAAGQITFGGTVSNFKQSEKYTESGTRFINLVEIKSNKIIELTFGSAVKAGSVNITIYVSHNNTSETRTAKIVKSGDSSITDSVAIAPGEGGVKPPYVVTFGLTGQSAGTYIIDATNTINMYGIEITYTVDYGN